ncbi:hypothetical protein D3C78_1124350 [compost metagenome]
MIAHFLAHLAYLQPQRFAVAWFAQDLTADRVKLLMQRRIAMDDTRPHQCLVLPGPGLVLLIIGKGFDRADQHAGRARRPQASVHLVQNAGGGAGTEQVHDALRQTQIKLTAVDAAIAVGHHVRWTIQNKHQIKIGTVAQLPTAQFSVANHGKTAPFPLLQMGRLTIASNHVVPRLLHHRIDNGLGQIGEVIAHFHHRQRPGDIPGGDA